MKFSKKSRYGLISLIDLSVHAKNGHVALNSIAERNDISPQYLEQVFAALRRAGIVKSIKGPQGGYLLNHPAEKITVAEILEALDGVSFGDEFHSPLVAPFETKDYRYGHATHGYLPEKGPQPVFYAKGPDFREHVVLEHARLVDEAPTFAELLGLEFPNVQGSCLWELLKKGRGYDTNSF